MVPDKRDVEEGEIPDAINLEGRFDRTLLMAPVIFILDFGASLTDS